MKIEVGKRLETFSAMNKLCDVRNINLDVKTYLYETVVVRMVVQTLDF